MNNHRGISYKVFGDWDIHPITCGSLALKSGLEHRSNHRSFNPFERFFLKDLFRNL